MDVKALDLSHSSSLVCLDMDLDSSRRTAIHGNDHIVRANYRGQSSNLAYNDRPKEIPRARQYYAYNAHIRPDSYPRLLHALPPRPPTPKPANAPPAPFIGGSILGIGAALVGTPGLLWKEGRKPELGTAWMDRNLFGWGRSSVLYWVCTGIST